MRRGLAYLLLWALATTATVTASWLGMRSVLDAASTGSTLPLSAAALRSSESAPGTSTRRSDVPAAGSPTSPDSAATSPGTPQIGPATPAPAQQWLPVSNGRGGTAYRRKLGVQGGMATFWVEPGDVHLVEVRAHRGYRVEQVRHDEQSLTISFVSARHTSRMFVTWREGEGPYAEVSESVT